MMRIEEIDANFQLSGTIPQGFLLHSPWDAPFQVDGLVPNAEKSFCRLPLDFLPGCPEGIQNLAYHLAGGCIRFSTDAKGLGLVWKLKNSGVMPHFTACGQSGMELYAESDQGFFPVKNFLPQMNNGLGCKLEQTGYADLPGGMRSYVLYLPLYNGLDMLYIALPPDAALLPGRTPKISQPIVFYGSSITQGGCASRPGNAYQAMISRRFNCDYRNLGFSGSARGEDAMIEYLADQKMALFFLDYDHNAPTPDHLVATHERLYLAVREKQPDLPIIMASKTDIPRTPAAKADTEARRAVVQKTYENALAAGDKKVRFIDGGQVFRLTESLNVAGDSCTVDGCHPNDLGFACMAKAFGDVIGELLSY